MPCCSSSRALPTTRVHFARLVLQRRFFCLRVGLGAAALLHTALHVFTDPAQRGIIGCGGSIITPLPSLVWAGFGAQFTLQWRTVARQCWMNRGPVAGGRGHLPAQPHPVEIAVRQAALAEPLSIRSTTVTLDTPVPMLDKQWACSGSHHPGPVQWHPCCCRQVECGGLLLSPALLPHWKHLHQRWMGGGGWVPHMGVVPAPSSSRSCSPGS